MARMTELESLERIALLLELESLDKRIGEAEVEAKRYPSLKGPRHTLKVLTARVKVVGQQLWADL